jgi:D-alanine-D-alanine ligase
MSVKPLHIAVLMGGWSSEREVSLVSGNGIADALTDLGHKVTRIDMDRDVALRLHEAKPDLVFNALHGTPGEDGTVQGMLDLMGLKYTHSGLTTSVIAIDKELTKQQLVPHGIPMPVGTMVDSESLYDADPMPRPYVLKPVNEGSSVGVAIVTREGNYGNPIARDVARTVAGVRPAARRAVHPRARADHRGARGSCARRHRTQAQERLLRL